MKISAVIITYNEAANIGRCLDAAQLVADEIIIVDSFSSDDTKTICEQYPNLYFFENTFEGYGEQKNWGNLKASGDYILSLDADEVLSKPLIAFLLKVKKQPLYKAYRLNRLTNFNGTWIRFAGWYPDKKIRLWEKSSAIWRGKAVHEVLEIQQGVQVGQLKGDLLHYSFSSVFDYLSRQNKYAQLSVIEQMKNGKTIRFLPSLLKSFYKFFLLYGLKLGFLHGYHGFVICLNGAGKYLINYAKYQQIRHSKTANKTLKGLPAFLEKANTFSFFSILKICSLIHFYKKNKVQTVEFLAYNDLKLGGIAAFWAGVPNVIFHTDGTFQHHTLFNDFLFSTIVTQQKRVND